MKAQQSPAITAPPRQSTNLQSVGMVLLSVALGAIGQLVLKSAVTQMGKLELSITTLTRMATNPTLILALAIYAGSAVLWLLALMKADLSFAYPFLSLTYIAVLIGGAIFFHENITPLRVLGFVVIMSGLVVIALDERAKLIKPTKPGAIMPETAPLPDAIAEKRI